MTEKEYERSAAATRRRLLGALVAMVGIYAVGTTGYYLLGGGRWSLADCAYMTAISITTVGYGEILQGLNSVPYARLFTAVFLVTGAGIGVYSVSVLTTFLVEGEFFNLRRRRKMQKRIRKLSNHLIVCGAGRTGTHIVSELAAAHWGFVVIDTDEEVSQRCAEVCDEEIYYIVGDATHDQVLLEAGIERAYGVVAGLPDDRDNLYVVVTARELNPKLRIVTKAVDPQAVPKLRVAGADGVVSVNRIGGMRMASEMIRPTVVNFLDQMMRDRDKNLRFEEATIPRGSPLANRKLAESDIRRERSLLVVAAEGPEEGAYVYTPGPTFVLREGMTLILIGETESVQRLRDSHLFEASPSS